LEGIAGTQIFAGGGAVLSTDGDDDP